MDQSTLDALDGFLGELPYYQVGQTPSGQMYYSVGNYQPGFPVAYPGGPTGAMVPRTGTQGGGGLGLLIVAVAVFLLVK